MVTRRERGGTDMDLMGEGPSYPEDSLLRRCLVGSFPECDKILARNDVRKWAHQTFWEVIKGDIKGTMQYFHDHQVLERSLNVSM